MARFRAPGSDPEPNIDAEEYGIKMRLIILLVVLLIVGFLVNRQFSNESQYDAEDPVAHVGSDVPKVPVKPQDVQQFEKDMNEFIKNEASDQADKIDQDTQ